MDGATPQTPEGASLDEVLAHKTLATKAVLERMLTFAEAVCERLERLYAASGVALVAEATMELTMQTEPNAPNKYLSWGLGWPYREGGGECVGGDVVRFGSALACP